VRKGVNVFDFLVAGGKRDMRFMVYDRGRFNLFWLLFAVVGVSYVLRRDRFLALSAVLAGFIVLHLFSSHFVYRWGFAMLSRYSLVFKVLAVLLSGFFLFVFRVRVLRFLERASDFLFGGSKMRKLLLFLFISALVTLVFMEFKVLTRYGDWRLIIYRVMRFYLKINLTSMVHAPLFYVGFGWLFKTLNTLYGIGVEPMLRWVSYVTGFFSVYALLLVSDILGKRNVSKILLFLFALSAYGMAGLFFGYIELYPPLVGLSLWFIYFSVRCIKTGGSAIPSLVLFSLMLSFHLSAVWFGPSLLYLIYYKASSKPTLRKKAVNFILYGVIALILVAAPLAYLYWSFVPLKRVQGFSLVFTISGGPHGDKFFELYELIRWYHVDETINEILLISPAAFLSAVFLVSSGLWRRIRFDAASVFLFVMAFSYLLYSFVYEPDLGMPRDWDLFSALAAPLTLFFGYALLSVKDGSRYVYSIAVVSLLIHTIPKILSNAHAFY